MSNIAELNVSNYWNPVRITFGPDSLAALPGIFKSLPGKRLTLITGQAIMRELGILDRVRGLLAGRELSLYEGVEPNPQVTQAQAAVEFAREHGAESILGIGGGSALDTAKVVAAILPNGGDVMAVLRKERQITAPSLPTVMV